MIRFSLLGSGSSGNAILVATSTCKILIDNGLSYKQLLLRSEAIGERLDDLRAVFVTHEHADHVAGIGTLARKTGVPVYLTRDTFTALPPSVGKLPRMEFFEAGEDVRINGLTVGSFSVSHDAADPVGFYVECEGTKLGLAGDLGHPTELVKRRLAGSHGLILESNYCPVMLRRGSYPPAVQQRIHGKHGHLSNGDMCSLLAHLLHEGLQVVVLVHISEENNTPELASGLASKVVANHGAKVHVAWRDRPTPLFEILS